jgi:hypothetical protein
MCTGEATHSISSSLPNWFRNGHRTWSRTMEVSPETRGDDDGKGNRSSLSTALGMVRMHFQQSTGTGGWCGGG